MSADGTTCSECGGEGEDSGHRLPWFEAEAEAREDGAAREGAGPMKATMRRNAVVTMMTELGACGDALDWLRSLPASTTLRQSWELCERGDWLLWWLERMGCDRHWTGAAACACVRGVWPLLTDERSRSAVEVRERWNSGHASDEDLAAAWDAASAAAWAATSAAASAAAWAAASAAASAAAWAAASAAAWDAASAAAWDAAHRKCAKRVRQCIPWRIVEKTMREQDR